MSLAWRQIAHHDGPSWDTTIWVADHPERGELGIYLFAPQGGPSNRRLWIVDLDCGQVLSSGGFLPDVNLVSQDFEDEPAALAYLAWLKEHIDEALMLDVI